MKQEISGGDTLAGAICHSDGERVFGRPFPTSGWTWEAVHWNMTGQMTCPMAATGFTLAIRPIGPLRFSGGGLCRGATDCRKMPMGRWLAEINH